jgi:hypothetical protein
MAGHSRSKNGVLKDACAPAIPTRAHRGEMNIEAPGQRWPGVLFCTCATCSPRDDDSGLVLTIPVLFDVRSVPGQTMPLTEDRIRACADDEELFGLLSAELNERLPRGRNDEPDVFLAKLKELPVGLRAMAAIFELDVSICLDDLGWHFANWHHRGLTEETLWALRELEAFEEADLFACAYAAAQPFWDRIGELVDDDFDGFVTWYNADRRLAAATSPMSDRMYELWKAHKKGLVRHWLNYSRRYPHKVAQRAS